ncbi:uncharacterized protein PAC_19607 [Phialocephala subalpina]|uniref:Uncharacterized protein n=1 Tax=Phialocephala subalpina TaxID=576137 RepID=A0A1L7XXH0_9HELO|nr:uncharacterized protein PAC_19607 [Phialocephala subalpina]
MLSPPADKGLATWKIFNLGSNKEDSVWLVSPTITHAVIVNGRYVLVGGHWCTGEHNQLAANAVKPRCLSLRYIRPIRPRKNRRACTSNKTSHRHHNLYQRQQLATYETRRRTARVCNYTGLQPSRPPRKNPWQIHAASLRLRYWKKVLKGKKERQILVALQSLEREKTQLTLCLTAAQTEVLRDVQREVRRTESDMFGKDMVYPASPAQTEIHEMSNAIMEDVENGVPTDDKKETTFYKLTIGTIVSKTKGKQTNTFGKTTTVAVATEIQVAELKVEDEGIQTNDL